MTSGEINELYLLLVLEYHGATERYWANTDCPDRIKPLFTAFIWIRSVEGYDYWRDIYDGAGGDI